MAADLGPAQNTKEESQLSLGEGQDFAMPKQMVVGWF